MTKQERLKNKSVEAIVGDNLAMVKLGYLLEHLSILGVLLMEQSLVADNQQATPHDLSWLGGIVDGEGCITVTKQARGKVTPLLTIVNTNLEIIDRCIEILQSLKIGFHLTDYAAVKVKGNRPLLRIRVQGYKRVYALLTILHPYLVGKLDRALLILHLCESRFRRSPRAPYTDDERQLVQRVWDSCGFGTTWGKSSETIRQAARAEDMARSA